MSSDKDQLYVRVNQQEEMLRSFRKLENIVGNVNEALDILNQVREVKITAIDTIFSNLQEVDETLQDLDRAMPDVEEDTQPEKVMDEESEVDVEVESSVDEIHDELKDLQRELSQLGSD